MRVLIAALALLPALAGAQVYKCTDAQGRVNLTDQPCGARDGAVLLSVQPLPSGASTHTAEEVREANSAFDREMAARTVKAAEHQALLVKQDEFYARRRAHIGLRIGMPQSELYTNKDWNFPDDRNVTETARGTREQWVYSADPSNNFKRMYLYFDNYVLTAIQD
jgi:hypothetical protein